MKAQRFCPKCGKKGIKGDFCRECYEKEMGLEFKDIEAVKCVDCGRYFVKNRWKEFEDDDKAIIETAKLKIKNPKNLQIKIRPVYKEIQNKPGLKQDIELRINVEDQEFIIPATVYVKACPKCSKKGTQYYEGVLQLRNMEKELENFVRADLKAAELEGAHIAKQKKKKDMWDIHLTSKKYLRQLGKKLQKKFTGEFKESATLHTKDKQTSKNVYRLNVLFRQKRYNIGDIVEQKGKKVKITTIGKRVTGTELETGKKVFVE